MIDRTDKMTYYAFAKTTKQYYHWLKSIKQELDEHLTYLLVETNDNIMTESSYYGGYLHMKNAPAVTKTLCNNQHIISTEWWYRGVRHRDNDLPAITNLMDNKTSMTEWWVNGLRHRCTYNNAPAVIGYDGTEEWWFNGQLHNDYGPACKNNSHILWYKHGLLHREDGPAVSLTYGATKKWYINGVLHRLDGPAIKFLFDIDNEWWEYGVFIK